jgi:hypothetical protein
MSISELKAYLEATISGSSKSAMRSGIILVRRIISVDYLAMAFIIYMPISFDELYLQLRMQAKTIRTTIMYYL